MSGARMICMRKTFLALILMGLLLVTLPSNGSAAETGFNWKAMEDEAVVLLSRYIQIDTTNPPGNEIKAAQFFKEIFDREGIESLIIESAPGRGNIYARLRGNGSKKAIVMLNHMDVVAAETKLWKEPPFSGLIKDGMIWGRGALDAKGRAISELMTLLALKRQSVALKGDVIFLGTADEEAGGAMGAGYLVEKRLELFKDVGLVLNEGGGIRLRDDGQAPSYRVRVAEKTPLWLKLTAPGTPGHGSTPGSNMAVNKLVAALNRIMQYNAPIKVVPEVQQYYADIADQEPEARRKHYRDLRTSLQDTAFAAEFTKNGQNNASVRNTIAITGIKGSDNVNVIPAFATAQLDVRLLPGEDPQAFIADLRKVLADESIKIEIILSFPLTMSLPHPEAMKVIAEMAKAVDGGAPVISMFGNAFTDCHFFREKGIPCLGFIPLRSTPSEEGMTHGIDERLSVDKLKSGIRAMYEIVRKLAAE